VPKVEKANCVKLRKGGKWFKAKVQGQKRAPDVATQSPLAFL
jgi:hypothetical protein